MRSMVLVFLMACKAPTPTDDVLDADGDGVDATTDCNDNDDTVFPGALERCDDVDHDCDGDTRDEGAVHIEGGEPAADLADALLLAQLNQTIVLCPGTYPGAVVRDRVIEGNGEGVIINAGGVGSAIEAIGRVELRNLTLTGGVGSPGLVGGAVGGGINATSATQLVVSDVIIEGNRAEHGGGIALGAGPAALERVTIQDNEAVSGGGVHLTDGDLTCAETLITGNNADGGGGVRISAGSLAGCTVENNVAVDNGGGIYVSGVAVIRNVVISDNTSVTYGGGVYLLPSADVTLQGSTVQGNTGELGGGLFVNPHGLLDLTATTIDHNQATAEGGGLYLWSAQASSGTFSNNTATDFGGGVSVFEGGSLSGARIEANTAASGAGMRVRGAGPTTLSALQIVQNTASESGGGLYLREADLSVDAVLVQHNTAQERGGGVYLSTASVVAQDLLITGNDATIGGGAYISSAGVSVLSGAQVSSNTAETGAGVTARGEASLEVELVQNTASVRGGGLYTDGADVVVTGTVVCQGNIAVQFGGGIYTQAGSELRVLGTLSGNQSPRGAGVYINGGSLVSFTDGTELTHNGDSQTLGGGGVRINDGTLIVADTTFLNNTPDDVYTIGDGVGATFGPNESFSCTDAGCP